MADRATVRLATALAAMFTVVAVPVAMLIVVMPSQDEILKYGGATHLHLSVVTALTWTLVTILTFVAVFVVVLLASARSRRRPVR